MQRSGLFRLSMILVFDVDVGHISWRSDGGVSVIYRWPTDNQFVRLRIAVDRLTEERLVRRFRRNLGGSTIDRSTRIVYSSINASEKQSPSTTNTAVAFVGRCHRPTAGSVSTLTTPTGDGTDFYAAVAPRYVGHQRRQTGQ